jgi:hypothetical protein
MTLAKTIIMEKNEDSSCRKLSGCHARKTSEILLADILFLFNSKDVETIMGNSNTKDTGGLEPTTGSTRREASETSPPNPPLQDMQKAMMAEGEEVSLS